MQSFPGKEVKKPVELEESQTSLDYETGASSMAVNYSPSLQSVASTHAASFPVNPKPKSNPAGGDQGGKSNDKTVVEERDDWQPEVYHDTFDFDGENPVLALIKSSLNLVQEVGPPLELPPKQPRPTSTLSSKSDVHQTLFGLGKPQPLQNYADELKSIEKFVKENAGNLLSRIVNKAAEFPKGGMDAAAMIGNGILPPFTQPVMSPASTFRLMRDAVAAEAKELE